MLYYIQHFYIFHYKQSPKFYVNHHKPQELVLLLQLSGCLDLTFWADCEMTVLKNARHWQDPK